MRGFRPSRWHVLALVLVLVLGLIAAIALSGTFAADYDNVPKNFLQAVAQDDFAGGLNSLGNTNPDFNPTILAAMRTKVTNQVATLGPFRFHKLLREERIGDRLVKLTYMVGYENRPLDVTLTLYRPTDKWRLYAFNVLNTDEGGFKTFVDK